MAPSNRVSAPSTRRSTPMRAKREGPSEFVVFFGFLCFLVVFSGALLAWLGVLGSGVWMNTGGSRVALVADSNTWDSALRDAKWPVVVAFYSEGCPSCKRMRAPFLAVSKAVPEAGFIAVNAMHMSELSDEYHIKYVPTVFVLQKKGDTPLVYEGGPSTSGLKEFVQQQILKTAI